MCVCLSLYLCLCVCVCVCVRVCVCVCECGVHACDLVNVFPWMSVCTDDISMRISLWAMHALYCRPLFVHLHVPCFLICVCNVRVCVYVCVCVASACLCFSDTLCSLSSVLSLFRFFPPVFTQFSSCWVRCWRALRGEMGGEGGCSEGHSHVRHVRGRRRRCQCKSVSQSAAAVGRGSLSAAVPKSCISAGAQTSHFWLLSNQKLLLCSRVPYAQTGPTSFFFFCSFFWNTRGEKFCCKFLGWGTASWASCFTVLGQFVCWNRKTHLPRYTLKTH